MLFAAVLRPPAVGATLASVDTSAAERMPGVVQVVHDDDLIAVLADTRRARGGRGRACCRRSGRKPEGQPSTLDMPRSSSRAATTRYVTQEAGDSTKASRAAERSLEATYYVPYVAPAPMEPRAAVATWEGDQPHGLGGHAAPVRHARRSWRSASTSTSAGARDRAGDRRRLRRKSPYPAAHEAARLARSRGARCASRTPAPTR